MVYIGIELYSLYSKKKTPKVEKKPSSLLYSSFIIPIQ
jgi:hypothetical protein